MPDLQNAQSPREIQSQIKAERPEPQDLQSDEIKTSRPAKLVQSSRRPLFRT